MLAIPSQVFAATDESKILLVGIDPTELSTSENGLLAGKNIIRVGFRNNWYEDLRLHQPGSVILKQPSGFAGLYDTKGVLVRTVNLKAPPDIPAYNQAQPATNQNFYYKGWDQNLGYNTGGRRDPYRAQNVHTTQYRSQQKLAPGWGYNRFGPRVPGQGGGVTDTLLNFFSFAPIDTVSPFNYPGSFDQLGIAGSYSFGVLPHIGGLASEIYRGKRDQAQYNQRVKPLPYYAEQPVQYYSPSDPTNPISRDPNQFRRYPMPQAFNSNYPDYQDQANYYGLNSEKLTR